MTTRDAAWRGLGAAAIALAGGLSLLQPGMPGDGSSMPAIGPLVFAVAVVGVTLLVQGDRLHAAWRLERQRQRRVRTARARRAPRAGRTSR